MSGAQVTATSSESAQEEVWPLRVFAWREGDREAGKQGGSY